MSYPTNRVILFDRDMNPLPELSEDEVFSRVRTEEINGEHSLVITTTRRLQEGWRALTVDGAGKWREWVVTEIDESHTSGAHALGTYHLVWSLQYDLTFSYFHDTGYAVSIGLATSTTATEAAGHVLDGVHGWTVGACDAADIAAGTGCIFIRESAWSKLSKLVALGGIEADSEIEVSNVFGITARKLVLRAHLGSEEALRRFDWTEDLIEIKRTPNPGPYYCRVVPLGKGQQEYGDDRTTTFDYPLDITEETGTKENPGPYWIQDDEAAAAFRVKMLDGTYYYPTVAVSYDEDDPELLLNAAMDDLHNHTRPGVTYEASVVQFAEAGMSVQGVALGDDVQCVDLGFDPDAPLRIQGRVIKMEVDELSPETTTQLTIGQLRSNMTDVIVSMGESLDQLEARNDDITRQMATMNTARYIDELLDRINKEINATGGYAYFVPGEGIITYDIEVDDPVAGTRLDGQYPTKVTQIKGGSIRIADTPGTNHQSIDDWNWRTVFTADGINADLVTALHVVSGYIGNATNSNYWNLDTGEFVLRTLYMTSGTSSNPIYRYVESRMGTIYVANPTEYWYLTGGNTGDIRNLSGFKTSLDTYTPNDDSTEINSYVILLPYGDDYASSGSYYWNSLVSSHTLAIWSGWDDPAGRSLIFMNPNRIDLSPNGNINYQGSRDTTRLTLTDTDAHIYGSAISLHGATDVSSLSAGSTSVVGSFEVRRRYNNVLQDPHISSLSDGIRANYICAGTYSDTSGYNGHPGNGTICGQNLYIGTSDQNGAVTVHGSLRIYDGTLSCSGTVSSNIKSRLIKTENYSDRLLFCYETASPMFGDIGSSTLDEDGYAYVSIDDIFSETAHTDFAYQVFLQKCGPGDLWVSEKHPSYFVVQGTPGLEFDWELKAHQVDLENMRLDSFTHYEASDNGMRENSEMTNEAASKSGEDLPDTEKAAASIEDLYNDPIAELEQLYDEERAA